MPVPATSRVTSTQRAPDERPAPASPSGAGGPPSSRGAGGGEGGSASTAGRRPTAGAGRPHRRPEPPRCGTTVLAGGAMGSGGYAPGSWPGGGGNAPGGCLGRFALRRAVRGQPGAGFGAPGFGGPSPAKAAKASAIGTLGCLVSLV